MRITSTTLISIGLLQAVVLLVALVRAKSLAVLLGPAGFGVASTIDQTVVALAHLGALSLPFAALKFLARAHSEGEEAFREIYGRFFRSLLVLGIATALVGGGALLGRPALLGDDLAPYRGALAAALIAVPASMLTLLIVNTLAAAQAPRAGLVMNLGVTAASAAFSIAGAIAGGLRGLFLASSLATTAAVATGLMYLHLRLDLRVRPRSTGGSVTRVLQANREILVASAAIYVAMSIYSLAMVFARYVVLSRLGEAHTGLLQAMISLALTVAAVMAPMTSLYLTPLVNRQMPAEDKAGLAHDFAGKLLILLLLAALPAVLFPRLLLESLYSPAFLPAAGVLYLFVVWQCLAQVVNVYTQLLIGLEDVIPACVGIGMTYAVSMVFLPPLVSRYGLSGAAHALTAGMVVGGLIVEYRLRRHYQRGVPRRVLVRTALPLLVVLGSRFVTSSSAEFSLVGLVARGGYVALTMSLLWVILGADDRRSVRDLLARALGDRFRRSP